MPETVKKISEQLAKILTERPHFHGSIVINLFDGKCPNLNVNESIKIDK